MNRIQLLTQTFRNLKLYSRFATTTSLQDKQPRLPPGYNKPSAFSLFLKDNCQHGSNVAKQTSRISELWKNASEDIKKNYTVKAKEIGKQRLDEFNQLSEAEREAKIEENKEIIEKRKKRSSKMLLNKFKKATNYPKRPLTANAAFITDYFKSRSISSLEQGRAVMVEASESWKNLPDNEKQVYLDKAKEESVIYNGKVKKWKTIHGEKYTELKKIFSKQKISKKRGLYTMLKARNLRKKTAESRNMIKKMAEDTKI